MITSRYSLLNLRDVFSLGSKSGEMRLKKAFDVDSLVESQEKNVVVEVYVKAVDGGTRRANEAYAVVLVEFERKKLEEAIDQEEKLLEVSETSL